VYAVVQVLAGKSEIIGQGGLGRKKPIDNCADLISGHIAQIVLQSAL
jgi:hypothetical protein